MTKHRAILTLLSILILTFSARTEAQTVPLHFERLSTQEGLSQHSIYAILQDNDGFMWFGTLDGLNRFDGHRFEVFTPPKEPTQVNQTVNTLIEDPAGDLWVGTRGGLFRFDKQTEGFISLPQTPKPWVACLSVDPDSTLWLGSTTAGLFKMVLDSSRLLPVLLNDAPNANCLCFFRDHDHRLWLGTESQGIWVKPPNGDAWQPGSKARLGPVTAITQDSQGRIWVGGPKGLWRQEPDGRWNRPFKKKDMPKDILALFTDTRGMIWIGTSQGLYLIRSNRTPPLLIRMDPYRQENPQNRYIRCITQDRNDMVWVGAWGGLYTSQYHTKPFVTLLADSRIPSHLGGAEILSLCRDRLGGLWIGHEHGVDHIPSRTQPTRHYPWFPGQANPDPPRVFCLLATEDYRVWMASAQGLTAYHLHEKNWTHHALPVSPSTGRAVTPRAMVQGRDGHLWLASTDGLFHLDPETGTSTPADIKLGCTDIFCLVKDDQDGLYIGTWQGLYHYDRQRNSVWCINPDTSVIDLSRQCIRCIYRDANQTLWLGTRGFGLVRIDCSGAVTVLDTRDGLAHDWVQAIQPDDQERLWISTNNGITRFNPVTQHFRTYRRELGIENAEFNLGSSLQDANGRLCFGAMGGVVVFQPGQIHDLPMPSKIQFTGLEITQETSRSGQMIQDDNIAHHHPIPQTGALRISPSVLTLTIRFSSLSLASPEMNAYAYRLRPLNQDWHALGNTNHVTFTRLNPGDYVLEVKGANSDGIWNDTPSRLIIEVTPPWYRHTVFRVGLFLAAGLLIFITYRIRTRQIQQRNEWLAARVRQRTTELSNANSNLENELAQRLRAEAQLRLYSKTLEERVEAKSKDLMEMKKKDFQQQKLVAMGKAASTVAHEIKNPLSSLKMSLSALAGRPNLDDRDRRYLDLAVRDTTHMESLLKEMLSFTKPMHFEFIFSDLNSLVKEVLRRQEVPLAQSGIETTLHPDPELPLMRMDPARIDQVLTNCLINAIQAMPQGGHIEIRTVLLLDSYEAQVQIIDNGPGIDEADLAQLFDPFFTRKSSGTGLGLTVAQKIAQAHQGKLILTSQKGQGTTCTLTLPLDTEKQILTEADLEPNQA